MVGKVLNDRYRITERIGVGGMAEVYKAQDNVLGRIVAVKVMLPQYAADPNFTQRFRQEAASAANLQSPYIVNVYDWGQDDGVYFIVMEFVRGSDLKTAINQRGAINQRKAAEIGSQVCQALNVAHHQDIIHRDIKPQNIMVQPDGNVKVMDFGIAHAKNSMKTRTASVLGTAHYISPEQAQGKELTAARDIYSLGVVLYEAATGKLPFDGPDAVSVALMQVNDEPALPSDINPSIDPDLEDIILKAMMKNPRDRFATANDMRLALNDYLAGRPVNLGGFGAAETAVIGSAAANAGRGTVPNRPMGSASTPVPAGNTQVMPGGMGGMSAGSGSRGSSPSSTSYRNNASGSSARSRGGYSGGRYDNGGGNKKTIAIVAAIVAVLVMVAVAAFMFLGGEDEAETALVPNVVGQTLESATRALKAEGFEVGETDVAFDANVAAGLVIRQDPKASAEKPVGTTVNLVISQGTEPVKVPDLTNLTAEEAKRKLTEAGLKYKAGTAQYSETVEKDRVISQEPLSDTEVDPGTTVVYILSLGSENVPVPNLVGETEGAARAMLSNLELNVSTEEVFSDTVEKGLVVDQTPKADEKLKKGQTVHLKISKGAEPKTTYTVTAMAAGGGSVSPNSTTVEEGGSVTLTITPNSGYAIRSVTDRSGGTYSFANNQVTISNVTSNLQLDITFEEIPQQNLGGTGENGDGNSNGNSQAADKPNGDDESQAGQ
ncbi:MAG: Stk1 family PASTA domain-containing Ser/Thr kinase [Eggerthellaceae bacterium]|nr:Stk1 family PASTA domain-containing Ser/Thr kinase [Eggerthellaceae bacterium]